MAKRRGRGEGGIEQLPSGKWRATLSAGTKPDGSRNRATHTADSKKEVQDWLRKQLQDVSDGKPVAGGKTTVGEWLNKWLAIIKPKIELSSWQSYEGCVRGHLIPCLGSARLAKLTALDVEEMYASLLAREVPSAGQQKAGTVLRTALRVAVKHGLLPRNVASDAPKPKHTRPEMLCLTVEQARAFLGSARGNRREVLWCLALDTGARQGELLALDWRDIDWHAGTVSIVRSLRQVGEVLTVKELKTGGRSRRRLTLATWTLDALKRHREEGKRKGRNVTMGPVFVSRSGKFVRRSSVMKSFYALRTQAGIPPIRFHDLRHSCASILLLAGVNVKVVSERLGHAKIEITLGHYAHLLPGMQEAATATMNRLFG